MPRVHAPFSFLPIFLGGGRRRQQTIFIMPGIRTNTVYCTVQSSKDTMQYPPRILEEDTCATIALLPRVGKVSIQTCFPPGRIESVSYCVGRI